MKFYGRGTLVSLPMKSGGEMKSLKTRHDNLTMLLMLYPAVIFVFIISIIPLVYTFFLSFQNYNLLNADNAYFNGIFNYIEVFRDPAIIGSIAVTLKYTFTSVIVSMILGLGLALMANTIITGRTFYRITLFLPMMLTSVVVGVMWKFLYNYDLGVLNYLLESVGLPHLNWIGTSSLALVSVIIADIWQWTSYTFILALAALEALNPEPVEAARIDGANAWQIFFHIKFVSILPVLEVALVFRLIWAFRGFDLIYSLTKGGPGTSTETMALAVWRYAFNRYDIGTSSAISVIMFMLLMLLSLVILRRSITKEKNP